MYVISRIPFSGIVLNERQRFGQGPRCILLYCVYGGICTGIMWSVTGIWCIPLLNGYCRMVNDLLAVGQRSLVYNDVMGALLYAHWPCCGWLMECVGAWLIKRCFMVVAASRNQPEIGGGDVRGLTARGGWFLSGTVGPPPAV